MILILIICGLSIFKSVDTQQRNGVLEFCIAKPPDCDVYCQYGYKRIDGNACTCACYDPCQGKICQSNEICIAKRSENSLIGACRSAIDQCPYGVPVNTCFVSPCLLAECSIDRSVICVPDYCGRCAAHFFDRNTGQDVTLQRCRLKASGHVPSIKSGTCPQLTAGFCLNECSTDSDCDGPKKCCSNGCGHLCVVAANEKPGTCPLVLSPDSNCQSQCQSDSDCDGSKKCCSNGCAKVCLGPQDTQEPKIPQVPQEAPAQDAPLTACTRLKSAIESLASHAVLQGFLPKCDPDGKFSRVQCDNKVCWCVDNQGQEIFGTKSPLNRHLNCDNPAKCESINICNSDSCPHGFKTDDNGCPLPNCECINYCHAVPCQNSFQTCRLVHLDCGGDQQLCQPVPQCLPNPCPGGQPQIDAATGVTVMCNQSITDRCDANHWCHTIGFDGGGFCCPLPSTAIRQGHCPATKPNSSIRCVMECMVDADCAINQKCCYNGCALNCVTLSNAVPANLQPQTSVAAIVKPGLCPVINEISNQQGVCSIQCQHDGHCIGDQKCCKIGCNSRCVQPSPINQIVPPLINDVTTASSVPITSPSKPGDCAIPTSLHSESDQCTRICQSDSDCASVKKCCSTGCGTRCMYPLKAPYCIHLTSAMESLSTSNLIIAVPKCGLDGRFDQVQCSALESACWCVDTGSGTVIAGTKIRSGTPQCQNPHSCPQLSCQLKCKSGYKTDGDGCFLCRCLDICENIKCPRPNEVCVAMPVQCNDPAGCSTVPRCVVNSCPSGSPAKDLESGQFVTCESTSPCPSGFWCHNIGLQGSGVCCPFPVRQVHAGTCPPQNLVQLGSGGACFSECLADDDCLDNQKCCFNGCGLSCITASANVPGFIPTIIPNISPITAQITTPVTIPITVATTAVIQTTQPEPTPALITNQTQIATSTLPAFGADAQSNPNLTPTNDQKIGVCPRYGPVSRAQCPTDVAECSSDDQCEGSKKCCNDGCIKRCFYPEVTTACLHVKSAFEQLQQNGRVSSSFTDPQCRVNGDYEKIQCDPSKRRCWCVDGSGLEQAGTRVTSGQSQPDCENAQNRKQCPILHGCLLNCPVGYEFDDQGCPGCKCRNPCATIACLDKNHICILAPVDCLGNAACLPVPKCVPNACPHGTPLLNVTAFNAIQCSSPAECGPQNFCRLLKEDSGYCCPGPQAPPRPGHCPAIHLSNIGPCKVDCRQDSDCSVNKKCCYNGCGMSCLATVENQNDNSALRCPAVSAPFGHCVVECQADSDCRPDYKCCVNGCSRTCMLPTDKPDHSPVPRRAPGESKVGICPAQIRNARACAINASTCTLDKDCDGARKCCFDGCANRCAFPKVTTGCLHQQAAIQSILQHPNTAPNRNNSYVPQCKNDGQFERVQCSEAFGYCWCVDSEGMEIPGTRTRRDSGQPPCDHPRACLRLQCSLQCPLGYKLDASGCEICACHDPCEDIVCPFSFQICRLVPVECIDQPCLPVPKCIPNICPIGEPLKHKQTWELQLCDPGRSDNCPNTHWCHSVGYEIGHGFCCPITEGIESANQSCPLVTSDNTLTSTDQSCSMQCRLSNDCRQSIGACCFNGCGLSCLNGSLTTAHLSTTTPTLELTTSLSQVTSADVAIDKIGTCPSNPISNPGCLTECKTDSDCGGTRKCCVFGCGRKCQFPYNTTACLHWKAALEILARNDTSAYVPQCDTTGNFESIQCNSKIAQCWCVDENSGLEIHGTRTTSGRRPDCQKPITCNSTCQTQCQHGLKLDSTGCPLNGQCECKDPCQTIVCQSLDDLCITEKRVCLSTPCPPVPTCKTNPCINSRPIRDKSTKQLLICKGVFNNECGSDNCAMITGQSFGLCCEKTADKFTPAPDAVLNGNKDFPAPPDFNQLQEINFMIENPPVPMASQKIENAVLDGIGQLGVKKNLVHQAKIQHNSVAIILNSSDMMNATLGDMNITIDGTVYTAHFMGSSSTGQKIAHSSASDDLFSNTAFIGLMSSCAIFVVVVITLSIAAYCIFKRKKRSKMVPHLVTGALPSYNAAALYSHCSSEVNRPILETATDVYTRSLPRKKYSNIDDHTRAQPTHWNSSRSLNSTNSQRHDNHLFY